MGVIDFYPESNQGSQGNLSGDPSNLQGRGQSFTGDGSQLGSAQFYLRRSGSPTGNALAKIYAHSGTFGTSSLPIGPALATSDNFDVSILTTGYQLLELMFSGVNQINLTNLTNFVVAFEFSGGDAGNIVQVSSDNTSPTHGGNVANLDDTTWAASSTTDMIFYVNDTGPPPTPPSFQANINGGVNIRPAAFQPGRAK